MLSYLRQIEKKPHKDIKATQSEKYDFVMDIANGQMEIGQINAWIERKLVHSFTRSIFPKNFYLYRKIPQWPTPIFSGRNRSHTS
jgi:hypothetical protein